MGEALAQVLAQAGTTGWSSDEEKQQKRRELTRTCPTCGATLEPLEVDLGPLGVRLVPGACKVCPDPYEVERERRRKEEVEKRHRDRLALYERAFPVDDMGPRLKRATFDTWERREGTANALRRALQLMQRIVEPDPDARVSRYGADRTEREIPPGLLLCGSRGGGKSHLAAAIAHAARERGKAVAWVHVPQFLVRLQGLEPEARQELLDLAARADVLVLDELGGGKLTAAGLSWLLYLVDYRYRQEGPLVVTCNPTPDELEEVLRQSAAQAAQRGEDASETDAERIMDRLVEHCRMVQITATSYRQQVAEARRRRVEQG